MIARDVIGTVDNPFDAQCVQLLAVFGRDLTEEKKILREEVCAVPLYQLVDEVCPLFIQNKS